MNKATERDFIEIWCDACRPAEPRGYEIREDVARVVRDRGLMGVFDGDEEVTVKALKRWHAEDASGRRMPRLVFYAPGAEGTPPDIEFPGLYVI